MPCRCFDPAPPERVKRARDAMKIVVEEMKYASENDYEGLSVKEMTDMLEHMYYGKCKEWPHGDV